MKISNTKSKSVEYPITKNPNRPKKPFLLTYYYAGSRIRKSFADYKGATSHYDSYLKSLSSAQSTFWSRKLSISQVSDIEQALNLLSPGASLLDAVNFYNGSYGNSATLPEAIDTFLKTKEKNVVDTIYLTYNYRLKNVLAEFKNWENITADSLREWLLKRGTPKTISHYFALIRGFYKFAVRRQYIKINPCDFLHHTDFPKVQSKQAEILSVENTQIFLSFIEENYPEYTTWFALAFFAGVRRAEINRIESRMIDMENKRITLPKEIVKTGDSWSMEEMPEAIWVWLKRYGKEILPLPNRKREYITRHLKKALPNFKWVHNAARHSFATYHLSLYRDAPKTSLLLRHREPSTLWQHYLGGLTAKDIAEQYFSIAPKN